MTTIERPVDVDKLMSFVFRAVDEVGATLNTALVVMGLPISLDGGLHGGGRRRKAADRPRGHARG